MSSTIGGQIVRGAFIFQGLIAFSIMFIMVSLTVEELTYEWFTFYDFLTSLSNGLFAAGILFIIFIQWNPLIVARKTNLVLEATKSFLATSTWLWYLLDAAFGHSRGDRPWPPHDRNTLERMLRPAFCAVILLMFFYPTLLLSSYEVRTGAETFAVVADEEGGAGEREPLLRP